ncbi:MULTISPECIES: 3-deoxy-7-phosphoheptulonate synthase [Streptomyces]|uniref:Phospho-2-dehydro-3-deoxyheptonate aldolase n=1 Tax=Streptomyces evansiae TaxID=3075535 RepID=A0ABU2R039_9ACTN|nr:MULTISPECIES: 3-deoxy-7-phosphoheptulonate synthase [unclassified Streptomyces]MDT0409591.1 3-deoxy-7-phosphoheptulonate synthase [Streptomyces sp. DSM 41979]MYQ57039.1 phospho-2-dehydro-3-deoxyheptonate aldolase [Streptomyces sp. SID4926]SCE53828.1 3-deoxy-D-arabinoheptulosonate-7-phosphate synthase [Streptomyces sp. DfronAA-171]
MTDTESSIRSLPSLHQPDWDHHPQIKRTRTDLRRMPALVDAAAVRRLGSLLSEAAAGHLQVIQAGDCAEDPAEATPEDVARKMALLDVLAGTMRLASGKPVLRVGRLAGQFAKPRSQPTEVVHGVELPSYRGHMVNRPEPDPELRRHDPGHLLTGYRAASDTMHYLGWRGTGGRRPEVSVPVWTSHEALLLDYELPMLRREPDGSLLLTSTHWPWVGERTRQLHGAHVALLAAISNPVAVKIGPRTTVDEIVGLCERLDPERVPGRLTLIARMGADRLERVLPALVAAVAKGGHPVLWLSDPMHGNTVTAPDGLKTRMVETVISEVRAFREALPAHGGTAGGLHLETTPEAVTECASDVDALERIGDKYLSFCDPRLNVRQAVDVVSAWRS